MNIRCSNCGLLVQVPPGGRRLCGCGAWLSGEVPSRPPAAVVEPMPADAPVAEATVAEQWNTHQPPPIPEAPVPSAGGGWPRIEGDLAAIERLNDGYRRIKRELNKSIVGQEQVIEE